MDSCNGSKLRRANNAWVARLVVLCAIQMACATLRADVHSACPTLPRPQDELWLVSGRGLGCGDLQQRVAKLQIWRYDREESWTKANLDEFLASDDPSFVTTIFVHGNRISCDEAFTKGWSAYRTLVRCADERPIRFVVWSWPSEAVDGPLNDARVKAGRTDPAAFHLAWFVDQLNPQVPVSYWGHSFGARVVTGALHLLGGGEIQGARLEERRHADRQPMHAVLLAAALDDDWLLPGHCHGQALSQTASLLLVNNGCDRLLQRYHLIYGRRCCQQALGYVGLNTSYLPAGDAEKVSQIDACCQVGKRHTLDNYLASSFLVAQMRPHLLFSTGEPQSRSLAEPTSTHEPKVAAGAQAE
jgi:hypothetical protein